MKTPYEQPTTYPRLWARNVAAVALLGVVHLFSLPQLSLSQGALGAHTPLVIPKTSFTNTASNPLAVVQGGALMGTTGPSRYRTQWVTITAYSSTPDQTDDSPFIAANGTRVYDGMIAANFLRFGTRVYIPSLFGHKLFEVHDRMHPRFNRTIDVWMPSRQQAKQFGVKYTEVVIVE